MEPGPPNAFILALVAAEEKVRAMEDRYRTGGYGYSEAKKALFEAMWTYFEPFRQKRVELERNLDFVQSVLRQGAERARTEARRTLDSARRAVGID